MIHYKDKQPIDTILEIKKILTEIGLLTIEEVKNPTNGCFWVFLRIHNTSLSSNGKGITYELALASAYGELMERLQTLVLFRYHNPLPKVNENYVYFPDESYIEQKEFETLIKQIKLYKKNRKIDFYSEFLKIQNNDLINANLNELLSLEYYNIATETKIKFPIKLIDLVYGSNGMCSGNTKEEALVQGLSEILERYVNIKVVKEKIKLPVIPLEVIEKKYGNIAKIVNDIEHSTNFKVYIRDASLMKGYPVACVLLVDTKRSKYFVKFGAHPEMSIAIERCLTEIMQGRDINSNHWLLDLNLTQDLDEESQIKNLESILHNGYGVYPKEFFDFVTPDYQYKIKNKSYETNREMLDFLLEILKHEGCDVYLKDYSYLGFNSYHIIIPGMSEIYFSLEDIVSWRKEYQVVRELVKKLPVLGSADHDKIKGFMLRNNYTNQQSLKNLLGVPYRFDTIFSKINTILYYALIEIINKNYSKCILYLNSLLSTYTYDNIEIKCLRDIVYFKFIRQLSYSELENRLAFYYEKNFINKIYSEYIELGIWENENFSCYHCDSCKNSNCYMFVNLNVYSKIQERIKNNYEDLYN